MPYLKEAGIKGYPIVPVSNTRKPSETQVDAVD